MTDGRRFKNDVRFLEEFLKPVWFESLTFKVGDGLPAVAASDMAFKIASRDKEKKMEQASVVLSTTEGEKVEGCDVLLIAPLPKEQQMICLALGIDWATGESGLRGVKEFSCGLEKNGSLLRIVVSCIARPGNVKAGTHTMDILHRHKPKFAMLIGIGATFEDVKLGHAIASSRVHYNEGGVRRPDGSKGNRDDSHMIDGTYLTLLQYFENDSESPAWRRKNLERLLKFMDDFDQSKPLKSEVKKNGFKFSVKEILSQEELRRDGKIEEEAAEIDERIRSVEMEGYGFADACKLLEVPWIVFRGHCDHGDPKKNDIWQRVAALSAAMCVEEFLLTEFVLPTKRANQLDSV